MGAIPIYKIAGAAAEAGLSLAEVAALAERYASRMATLAVALRPATHPATGHELFTLPDDEMEIGMGQHGEPGTGRMKLQSADGTAEAMLEPLLAAVRAQRGDRLLVLLNGAGATTLMELFLVMRRIGQILEERGLILARARVGEFLTVQEMAGFQMHVGQMDDELLRWWDAPCEAPYFTVT